MIDDFVAKGKVVELERSTPVEFTSGKKQLSKKKKEPVTIDPNDSSLSLDYTMVQKFSQLSISPPADATHLEATSDQLKTLIAAL